ncbi:ABC transporter substrate-binding protein [Nocardioides sp.]|uniref:ABC transporter substrate-binding protein n=1 Tax=Nocardioides sp. TaxID=35761 RepID=UPI0035139A78
MTMNTHSHRRRPRAAALPAVLLLLLAPVAACGATADTTATTPETAASAATAGPWTWTDGTGATLTLDTTPTRIAAMADQALALLSYGITPVAIFGRVDVASDPRFADYDLSEVAIVGNTYGEIDLEALAAAAPDLVVTGVYPVDREGTIDTEGPLYAFADVEQQRQIAAIAPIVAVKIGGEGLEVIESTTSLAASLGADPAAVEAARAEFEQAGEELRDVAAARPEIEVTQMYADTSGIYVVKTADEPETQLYSTFGVDYTALTTGGDYYWDIYSWENAEKMMTGDVLLTNVEGYDAAELADQPTFAEDPALLAGQVEEWNGAAMDYASQAAQMRRLAAVIESADDVV